eukprot:scaffold4175_cov161-Prasinococcus_capsulatus_cf.AAC.1
MGGVRVGAPLRNVAHLDALAPAGRTCGSVRVYVHSALRGAAGPASAESARRGAEAVIAASSRGGKSRGRTSPYE